jgi:hypothetical protein
MSSSGDLGPTVHIVIQLSRSLNEMRTNEKTIKNKNKK